ncbi:MAG: hypothetical protein ABEJ90_00760 [Halobacterium sp.]
MDASSNARVGLALLGVGIATMSVAALSVREAFESTHVVGIVTGATLVDVTMLLALGAVFVAGAAALVLGLLLVTARLG